MKRTLSLLAVTAALFSVQAHAHQREGLELVSGVDTWSWVENDSEGARLLKESGPVKQLGGRFTFSTHADTVFHTLSAKVSDGRIQYDGGYIGGGALQSHTRYRTLRVAYDLAAPLFSPVSGLEWTAGVGYESRDRYIWNPSANKDQVENYQVGFARAGVQVPRPAFAGLYGGAGVNVNFATTENIHATEMGFKTSPTLKPKTDIGGSATIGFAFNPRMSVEVSHELMRFKESPHAVVQDASSKSYEIFQPRSILNRTSLQVLYKF